MKDLMRRSLRTADAPLNLLFVMTDQQRGDCLGCDGHPALETPNLDQLAAEGTRFRCAYTATPSCVPARATLLTGMDQWHTGILGMGRGGRPIPCTYRHTLPGELARAGYHTQGIGKMHFHPPRALQGFHGTLIDEHTLPNDYDTWLKEHRSGPYGQLDHGAGWNSWMARPSHLPEHLHPTHWTAQQAMDWLDRRDPNRPFFLKVSFMRPHPPNDPPQVYYDLYKDRPMSEPPVGDWVDLSRQPADEAADVDAWRSRRSKEEVARTRACYYANITFVDHQLGRLLRKLRHEGLLQNTLIIFTSDHGEMLGDHYRWRKTQPYEGSVRIPMIVRPPERWGAPRGQVLDHVVELRDVMPTFLDAAGLEIPGSVDGRSTLPLVRGRHDHPWRPWIQGEHSWSYGADQANFYLTDGREKYIWFPYADREQFFDLTQDPQECRDLARSPGHQGRIQTWRRRLVEQLDSRRCGLVEDGKLSPLAMDACVTSPHYARYGCWPEEGNPEAEEAAAATPTRPRNAPTVLSAMDPAVGT